MNEIAFVLVAEGTSDQVLLPVLEWLLKRHVLNFAVRPQFADLSKVPQKPKGLKDKIKVTLNLYENNCDLLFIHRDADTGSYEKRLNEIKTAIDQITDFNSLNIPVIPVRMTEAWLLLNENAIRRAAGNPSGNERLTLPGIKECERIADPKALLFDLLRRASGLKGRKLKNFSESISRRRVSNLIDDFAPLRSLTAFQNLEELIEQVSAENGWN